MEQVSTTEQVATSGIADPLERLHARLDAHFRALADERKRVRTDAPVFALEHGLDAAELEQILSAVRAAVAQGFVTKYRKWWLPFVVYAAESGYGYVGEEYWQTFAEQTPRWDEIGDRDWIRYKFIDFAEQYGGIRPKGAFAEHFPIIAWPITHAVLPIYLQRNLAQLLYDFRTGLTSELLNDPEAIGARLASRAGTYTERFRIFCENTSLLGSVAVALLGEGDESPYLLPSTQQRLVDDLSRERESRHWLTSARQTASHVRAKGFAIPARAASPTRSAGAGRISPPRSDPKLQLRLRDGKWQLWASLPDLNSLNETLGEAAEELRGRHATIEGVYGPLAKDRHLYPGQWERLKTWPRSDLPFLQLKGAPAHVNRLIADQCALNDGPVWLFRLGMRDMADEFKGRVVRLGQKYVLVQIESAPPPQIAWSQQVPIDLGGVRAAVLDVPSQLRDADRSALVAVGLTVVTDITVQPVGFVASAWDGEGEMEWLAGEVAAIAITSEIEALRCELTLDDQKYRPIDWPRAQRELFLQLADLAVGRHELSVRLILTDGSVAATETLFITIRDPQVRPESATAAEGVRLLASPARPTLAALWDGHASLLIEGPSNTTANLRVSLRSETTELALIQCSVELPVSEVKWPTIAKPIRDHPKFSEAYDDAESVKITISREGIGFATLTCDRGFQPLRWMINRHHGDGFSAHLVDRTDGSNTRVELFTGDEPLNPEQLATNDLIAVPPLGGLLRAMANDVQQSVILPIQPNEVMRAWRIRPYVQTDDGTPQEMVVRLAEGYRMWRDAERPGDVFAQAMQAHVLEAIAREAISLLTGGYWAAAERRLIEAENPVDLLEDLQAAVGVDQQQRALAAQIARCLWAWSTPIRLVDGFHELITPVLKKRGIVGVPTAFLLQLADLAGRFGDILNWDSEDRDKILDMIAKSPVLLRAARFAVLGARMFIEADEAEKGF